jgi:bifunctional enzyme CysN/CysC
VQPQHFQINKEARGKLNNQKPCVLWFTGLSGSGKSTLANELEKKLFEMGHRTYVLDGDNIRHGLNKDLGFTTEDRIENIRRVAEVAKLMVDAGMIVIATFISPYKADRDMARSLFHREEFFEVFINTPLEICEQRDPKGLYKKARRGELKNFTGIDSAFQPPEQPELSFDTSKIDVKKTIDNMIDFLNKKGL